MLFPDAGSSSGEDLVVDFCATTVSGTVVVVLEVASAGFVAVTLLATELLAVPEPLELIARNRTVY